MTELKPTAFRVWDNEEKRYVETEGFYLSPSGALVENTIESTFDADLTPADPTRYTVERFTGFLDMAKKPVYEGDAFHSKQDSTFKGVIKTDPHKGALALWVEFQGQSEFWRLPMVQVLWVVGHIHDEGRGGDGNSLV